MSEIVHLTESMEKGFILIQTLIVNIKNFKNHPLNAYPEQSIITSKSSVQGEKAEMCLDIYKDVSGRRDGVPVIISCELNDKTYLLCVESDSVILKESEVPEVIPSDTSEFIFFKRNLFDKFRTFESSVKNGYFLALNEEDQSLTLQPYDQYKCDEYAAFLIDKEHNIHRVFKWTKKATAYHFWNNLHDLLIAYPEESIAAFEPEGHAEEEKATFFLNTYRELAFQGFPVIISCKINNKTYLLHAENNSVILKEGELPEVIPTKTSELIFYMAQFSDGKSSCRFKSSYYENSCLAWDIEGPEKKLILKTYSENEIDETMEFDLQLTRSYHNYLEM